MSARSVRVSRHRQPEGRRRQDDDRDQSRHGAGGDRRAGAGDRPRSAGQRLDRARHRRRGAAPARPTTCSTGAATLLDAAVPTSVPGLSIVPPNSDLVGIDAATRQRSEPDVPPARCGGEPGCGPDSAGRGDAADLRADRLPAVAQPADAQRAGGGQRGAGAGAVRVLRARRHHAAQRDDRSDPRQRSIRRSKSTAWC